MYYVFFRVVVLFSILQWLLLLILSIHFSNEILIWSSLFTYINMRNIVYTCYAMLLRWVASVVSDSVRPHGQQPTRLLCPRDSLGKNTGVGCHCLLHMYIYNYIVYIYIYKLNYIYIYTHIYNLIWDFEDLVEYFSRSFSKSIPIFFFYSFYCFNFIVKVIWTLVSCDWR